MAFFNRTRASVSSAASAEAGHLNWMGGRCFDVEDPLLRLRLAAASCFFGEPMYYHGGELAGPKARKAATPSVLSDSDREHLRAVLAAVSPAAWRSLSPAGLLERAIDDALDRDPEATLIEAVRLRREAHIRVTPQVILVRAARHRLVRGTGLVRRFAPAIVQRADEPAVGLAYQLHRFGKPIPNALKKAWRDALARFDDGALAKYRLESHQVKTVDVVNLVHARSGAVDRLAKETLRLGAATRATWESIVSKKGSTRTAWEKALPVMGHMALLRNLRNLIAAGVAPQRFVDALVDGVAGGKQLPFRYYSAYRAIGAEAPRAVHAALERCIAASVAAVPKLPGRVMCLADNSGSAQGTATSSMGTMQVSTIGNLTGILAGMRADEGFLGVFGDRLDVLRVRPGDSVFGQLDTAERSAKTIGGATENGIWLFWDAAIRERQHWDQVFVMSDMQAGHGGLYGTNPKEYARYTWNGGRHIDVARLVAEYRRQVNPRVNVFLVQIAGYQDTLVPEMYERTYVLGGWGEGLLRFAAEMARLGAAV